MGKILDFLLTGSWEEYKRVRLYEDIGNSAKNMSREQLVEIRNMMNKVNSKLKK